jgi:peptidase M23-like protein/integrase family protein with SAM-like domain
LIESFLIDRKAQGLSPDTIELYTKKLKYFMRYCERQALTQISQITSDFIRRFLLELSETHNPGGVHVCFRALRTMLYWIEEEEIMPDGWKNPIRRVKAPKLPIDPIEPIQIEEIQQLLKTCKSNYSGGRLVVIENGDYQIWMAHLSEINVQPGEIVEPGQVIGLSGGDRTQDDQAGNSSGPHLHYGVKMRTGPDTYVWVDPASFFDLAQMTPWGCSK